MERRLKHWGWGYEDEQLAPEARGEAARFFSSRLGFGSTEPEPPAPLPSLAAPRRRARPPAVV